MKFETSEDQPLTLRAGSDQQTAIYNRIAVINRVNYLTRKVIPNFDIRLQSDSFRYSWDLLLWKKYYKNEDPNKPVDEELCQRGAEMCIEMVQANYENDGDLNEIANEFSIWQNKVMDSTKPLNKDKDGFFHKFVKWFGRK